MATRTLRIYRLDVGSPVGALDDRGWFNRDFKPLGWEPESCHSVLPDCDCDACTDSFTWPKVRNFLSRSSAERRAALLRSYGAQATVVPSQPVQWSTTTPRTKEIPMSYEDDYDSPEPERTPTGAVVIEAQLVLNTPALDLTAVAGRPPYGEPVTVADLIITKAITKLAECSDEWNSLRRRVTDITDDEIRAKVADLIRETLTAGVQPTNTYGEPTGKPTTLRDLIMAQVQSVLALKHDPYDRNPSPLQQVVRAEIHNAFVKELSDAVKGEKAKVVAAVREKAADVIAQTVTAGLKS
jgi:hypothetical protein